MSSCLCTKGPSHTTDDHVAIASVKPVFPPPPPPPPPTMHAGTNINFIAQSWGPKVLPSVTISPRVRFMDTGTGRPSSSHPVQQAWLKTNITDLHAHGPFKVDVQLYQHGLLGGIPIDEFRDIMHFLASLGPSQVGSVELWNEPDVLANATPVDTLGAYAQEARNILGPANIPFGGPSSQGHRADLYFAQFATKYGHLVDFLSHHIYLLPASLKNGTVYADQLAIAKALVAVAKLVGKPVWITEWNINPRDPNGNVVYAVGSVTGDIAAAFIKDTLRAFRDAGITESMVWHWDGEDQPMNLLTADRSTTNFAGQAFLAEAAALVAGTL